MLAYTFNKLGIIYQNLLYTNSFTNDNRTVNIVMDCARRNAIVFRCILSSMDIHGVMKISSVCREWYEQINSDNLLWKRLCVEEEILPEEWDWQDNEQWLMGPPCKWKQYYINYQRTAFNFNKKQFKPYKYRVHGLNVDYDGQTLLFEAFDGLNICRINKNNIEFKQRLKFTNKIAIAKTNTDFIVILQNEGLHFCIFHRLNDKYIFYYKVYLNKDGDFFCKNNLEETFEQNTNICSLNFYIFKTILIISCLNDDGIKKLYFWDLIEKKLLLNFTNYKYLNNDTNFTYVINNNKDKLMAYNEKCEINYKINFKYQLCGCKIFFTNQLISVLYEDTNLTSCISSWNKFNGKMISLQKLNVNFLNVLSIIYPKNDICIVLFSVILKRTFLLRLAGFHLKFNFKLWSFNISENNYQLRLPKILYKFQKLIVENIIGGSEYLEVNTVFDVYCALSGNHLYTIDLGITKGLELPFIFNDLIVFFKPDDKIVSVYLYR